MPVAVPGAAVSPGARICILAKAPALTVMAGLVLLVLLPSVTSETVSVWLPALLKVTLNEPVPLTSAVSAGKVALESLELRLFTHYHNRSIEVATKRPKLMTALTLKKATFTRVKSLARTMACS